MYNHHNNKCVRVCGCCEKVALDGGVSPPIVRGHCVAKAFYQSNVNPWITENSTVYTMNSYSITSSVRVQYTQ
jgi:hypothetical protein